MKALYIKPETRVYSIKVENSILTSSSFGIDSEKEATQNDDGTYGFSRQGGSSLWDDDDE